MRFGGSPLPADSLKISRTIAGFGKALSSRSVRATECRGKGAQLAYVKRGRYVSKRPDGLRVDRDGCMKLDVPG